MGQVRRVGVVIAVAMAAQLAAQTPPEASLFTAVSVKPNTSGSLRSTLDLQPGGRFTAVNAALFGLIAFAYGDDGPLTPDRLSISEAWAERRSLIAAKFDILATAEREIAPQDLRVAVRQILVDRFKLVVHRESRTVASYQMVVARADGRLGPGLRRSSIDCSQLQPFGDATNGAPACGFQSFPGTARGRVLIGDLARRVLPPGLGDGRPIEDGTGLHGTFEFELQWTPDAGAPARRPDAPPAPPVDPNGASFVTALREQLGLRLDARTSAIDVLVVDRAERPSPD